MWDRRGLDEAGIDGVARAEGQEDGGLLYQKNVHFLVFLVVGDCVPTNK
jgi:hypothetical protein